MLKRKLKLFGHVLRTNPDDPLRQVLFEYNSYTPRIEHRRPGKPRTSWLLQSFKDAFGMLGRNPSPNAHPDSGQGECYRLIRLFVP